MPTILQSSVDLALRAHFASVPLTHISEGMQNAVFLEADGRLVVKAPLDAKSVLDGFRRVNPEVREEDLVAMAAYYYGQNTVGYQLAQQRLGDRVVPFKLVSDLPVNLRQGADISPIEFPVAIVQNKIDIVRQSCVFRLVFYASMGNTEIVKRCIDDVIELYRICIARGMFAVDLNFNDLIYDEDSDLLKCLDLGTMNAHRDFLITHIMGNEHFFGLPMRIRNLFERIFREARKRFNSFRVTNEVIRAYSDYLWQGLVLTFYHDNIVASWGTQSGVPLEVEFAGGRLNLVT